MSRVEKASEISTTAYASEILHNGGLVAHPSDTGWHISAALPHYKRLVSSDKHNNEIYPLVCIVKDIKMLKQYITELHPRIETLLFYYERPIIVLGKSTRHFPAEILGIHNKLAITITRDPLCLSLIHAIKGPLISKAVSSPLHNSHDVEQLVPSLRMDSDLICTDDRPNSLQYQDCPVISYDDMGNLHFLRD